MPTVEFAGNPLGPGLRADAPAGGLLVDVCDASRAPVPFSCRSASCGTCRVEVLEGLELFEDPSDEERGILEIFADPPHHRLACSARLRGGGGLVRIRIVED